MLRVDELQAARDDDIVTLGTSIQTVANERRLPVALVAVGLPSTRDVFANLSSPLGRGPSAGFLERQRITEIGNLDPDATAAAFEQPILDAGGDIDDAVLAELVRSSHGYPSAIKVIGHETWEAASTPRQIDQPAAAAGLQGAVRRLADSVYVPRWRTLSPGDRRYLLTAARLLDAAGEASTSAISHQLYGNATGSSEYRSRLIERHEVLEPGRRGTVRFTIPGFAEWTLRQRQLDPDIETRGLDLD